MTRYYDYDVNTGLYYKVSMPSHDHYRYESSEDAWFEIIPENRKEFNMRDPNRIDGYMEKLKKIWKDSPDLRFGQLLMNLLGEVQSELKKDLFYVEDKEFFDAFEKCYERIFGKVEE